MQLPASVDRRAIRRMQLAARALDSAVRIPVVGVRVGLDPIVGLLPIGGDVVAAVLSLYVVAEAARQGVSASTLVRMLGNVAVDALVGSIPIVGDLFDARWKANERNVRLAVADLLAAADEGRPRHVEVRIE
ncbi:MAG: DUF4112 domain-containing protein [Haloferacaceae archaeon]